MKFVLDEEVIIFSERILFYLCVFFAWFVDKSHTIWELDADVKVESS